MTNGFEFRPGDARTMIAKNGEYAGHRSDMFGVTVAKKMPLEVAL